MSFLENLRAKAVDAVIGKGHDFARGWAEGIGRYNRSRNGVTEASRFDVGTEAFAASQAAVAYCIGKEKG